MSSSPGSAITRTARGRGTVKISLVRANNRRKAFELQAGEDSYSMPYARLRLEPTSSDMVREVFVDPECGNEAFTYRLESGREDSVHLDAVLDYNRDPDYMRRLLTYRLTLEAREAVEESGLSKRELVRRLRTSPSQLYRLLDPTNDGKAVGQLLALLHLVGREVSIVEVTDREPS